MEVFASILLVVLWILAFATAWGYVPNTTEVWQQAFLLATHAILSGAGVICMLYLILRNIR